MADLPRCRLTTWADVERWVDRLAERIRSASAVPETIVALTRGGWVPSRLLSDRLGVRRLVSLRAQHWGVTATPDGKAKISEGLSGPIEGEKVLVVDDITDTGESLSLAVAHVAEQHPTRLESAACLHIAHSKFVPTYYAEEIPRTGWVWVVFPWNYWEDLASLATRAVEYGRGVSAVRETLRARSGLEVPLADLERVAQFVPIR
ncbi:MAG TPA: phosphoribosyltransferase [Thermoplasmata archaeon]|nr:phosphoribosyltransferase [Thermoplasmata archaeon]